jgi:hypothetical protein
MKRIGFLLPDISNSQLAYEFIKSANDAVATGKIDVIGFYDVLTQPIGDTAFPLMHAHEAWGFNGPLVATNFMLAARMQNFPMPTPKIFYLWDLDWLRIPRANYHAMASVYRDPSLKLVARSHEHTKAIRDAWGRDPETTLPILDVQQFVELVEKWQS